MYAGKKLNPYKWNEYSNKERYWAMEDPEHRIMKVKHTIQTCDLCKDKVTFTYPDTFVICEDCMSQHTKDFKKHTRTDFKWQFPQTCYLCRKPHVHYSRVTLRLCEKCYIAKSKRIHERINKKNERFKNKVYKEIDMQKSVRPTKPRPYRLHRK